MPAMTITASRIVSALRRLLFFGGAAGATAA